MSSVASFGVRGLTCMRCVVAALEELRGLPGVDQVGVDLVPFGESRVTVTPASAAPKASVRAALDRVGFVLIGRRRSHAGPGLDLSMGRRWAPAS